MKFTKTSKKKKSKDSKVLGSPTKEVEKYSEDEEISEGGEDSSGGEESVLNKGKKNNITPLNKVVVSKKNPNKQQSKKTNKN